MDEEVFYFVNGGGGSVFGEEVVEEVGGVSIVNILDLDVGFVKGSVESDISWVVERFFLVWLVMVYFVNR